MKHISILVPVGDCSLSNIEGTHQILRRVNDYLADADREPLFIIQLVGARREISMHNGLFTVSAEVLLHDLPRTDLVLIPSVHGDKPKILADNQELLSWIVRQYENGAAVASMCIGTFLLAGTGLLDGKTCTTDWQLAEEFRRLFPAVNL